MARADVLRSSLIALAAALALGAGKSPAPPPASAPAPVVPDASKAVTDKRYPANRAAELKARLLETPSDPAAASWALEYAGSPDVMRLEPVTRTAERAWAARAGLAASPATAERQRLQALLDSVGNCPLDSVVIKRAAQGLTRIGVVVPLSGRYALFGKTFVNGLRVAIDEHNRDFHPNLSLILHDSEGDPLVGARKARWLLKDHGVSLLVGEVLSANTAPLAAATQVCGAVLISPSATNERLAILGDGIFQLFIGPNATASALARQLAGESAQSSVAMLVAKTPDDSLQAAAVAKSCDFAAVRVLATERVRPEEADLSKHLEKLRAKKPTALVLIGPPRMIGNAGAQLPTAWPKARVFGFESMDPENLSEESREGLEGAIFFVEDYQLDGAPRDSFETHYRRAFKDSPTRMSVRGYIVGLAIDRAVEAGCISASQLREALRGQVYESDVERALRALRPVVPAFPERLTIREGKAVPVADGPVDP